jgi:hypothetical protein
MIVVDASVWIRAAANDGPAGDAARRVLTDDLNLGSARPHERLAKAANSLTTLLAASGK